MTNLLYYNNLSDIQSVEYRRSIIHLYKVKHNIDFETLYYIKDKLTSWENCYITAYSGWYSYGYMVVRLNDGSFTYIDRDSKILPYRFDFATDFNQKGLALVGCEGKVNWMNTRFEILNPLNDEFCPMNCEKFEGYAYLSNVNTDNISFARINYFDNENMVDLGMALKKSLLKAKINRR